MKIIVIGTGYVGLVAGTCFAELGFLVKCLDQDSAKIDLLRSGRVHIYEPGLEELVKKNINNERLQFATDKSILKDSDLILIAVGTPAQQDGSANLSYLYQALDDIIKEVPQGKPIMVKSTVPVGTAKNIADYLLKKAPGKTFDIISNPEFLREGSAVHDFMRPERVVIGANKRGQKIAEELYNPLAKRGIPVLYMDNQTAELAKYTANCYLAMRIAFLNEIADIAEAAEADIEKIAECIGMDSRIGRKYLRAGPGFGGSCFPKDTAALSYMAHYYNQPSQILKATIQANQTRKEKMVNRVVSELGEGNLSQKKCAILGVTFKADTDDIRDSLSIDIINALLKLGVAVSIYDPRGTESIKRMFGDTLMYSKNPYEAAEGADISVIITEWDEFSTIDMNLLSARMKNGVLLDFRNMFSLDEMKKNSIKYISIGRPIVN